MDAKGMAHRVRELRKEGGLTQEALAEKLVQAGLYDSLSKEMISRAEDSRRTKGDSLHDLRAAIIQLLTGNTVRGPLWVEEKSAQPA